MMPWKFHIGMIIVAAVCGLFSSAAYAGTDYPITDQDKAFVVTLKHAVESHDEKWMADNISLPIVVKIDGSKMTIKTKRAFLKNYDKIIDVTVEDAVRAQDENDFFKNWRGIMIGLGQVWVGIVCEDKTCNRLSYYIIAINNCWNGKVHACRQR